MEATIRIKMDNAAFEDCAGTELARILRAAATQVDNNNYEQEPDGTPAHEINLMDVNGNRVGACIIQ